MEELLFPHQLLHILGGEGLDNLQTGFHSLCQLLGIVPQDINLLQFSLGPTNVQGPPSQSSRFTRATQLLYWRTLASSI